MYLYAIKQIVNKNVSYCKFFFRQTSAETITLTESKTDYTGAAPKRYITKCFIQPVTVPSWYRESLIMKLNSTKKHYNEEIYFKVRLR